MNTIIENVERVINDARDKFVKELVSLELDHFAERTDVEILQEFCDYMTMEG